MKYRGRLVSVAIVALFNILRYFYYHQYLAIPFKANFFVLTTIFLAIAWWCGKQFDRVKYYSEKDPLTNTYNRFTVESYFQKRKLRSQKDGERLGIVLTDLDNFKQFNDTYGHHKGDELIVHIASVLNQFAGRKDLVVRWGGDEFIILVNNIDDDFQENYASRLAKEIEDHTFNNDTPIKASIGVAIYPTQGTDFQELIQIADREMYQAKGMKIANYQKSKRRSLDINKHENTSFNVK